MMKAGYFPCTQDPPSAANIAGLWREIVAEAQLAETVGFDSCLFSEHHQQADGYMPNPLLLAGLIGAKTERLRVGTCVLLLPLYHPIHVAEDAALVDVSTGGRLILGVGVGYQPPDFDAFRVPIGERARRCAEGVEILTRAWTEETVSFSGRHFQVEGVRVTPKPVQQPRPPIWMAAWTDPGLKRAARLADGWLSDPLQSMPVIRRFADVYREAAQRAGKKPFVGLMRDICVGRTAEEARAASDPLMYTHRFYFRYGAYAEDQYTRGVKSEEEWTFERAEKERFIVGTPEKCLEDLQRWKEEVRPDYLVLRMRHPGGPPHRQVMEGIRLFGERVLPSL
jgi:alkanesulfonate monooxygenase SsuD/methylene tetrahydromethanopterin reductase-like flavin-dependent oxidoreductase (luciferase family)